MGTLVSHFSHRPILAPGTQPDVLGGTWVRLEPCEGDVMVVLGESCWVGGLWDSSGLCWRYRVVLESCREGVSGVKK